ncbi:MAG: TetR/AcrR family transcriptional regulator [Pseudomonadota bacterium]
MTKKISNTNKASSKPPVRRRKDARPAEIIAAGIEEFALHGFERARLVNIAARAGISKGTIYLYFASKEALFAAAIEEHVIKVLNQNEAELIDFEGTTEELVRKILWRMYTKILTRENLGLLRILISEAERVPQLAAQYHSHALGKSFAVLEAVITRGISRGELTESAATKEPSLVMAPAVFLAIHHLVFAELEDIDVESFYEGHVELVLRGLGATN